MSSRGFSVVEWRRGSAARQVLLSLHNAHIAFEHIIPSGKLKLSSLEQIRDPLENQLQMSIFALWAGASGGLSYGLLRSRSRERTGNARQAGSRSACSGSRACQGLGRRRRGLGSRWIAPGLEGRSGRPDADFRAAGRAQLLSLSGAWSSRGCREAASGRPRGTATSAARCPTAGPVKGRELR
jgi:hypothetical protein